LLLSSRLGPILATAIGPTAVVFLSPLMSLAILAAGMIVGCIGGLIAARSAREIAD
jgi:hypothetical protein